MVTEFPQFFESVTFQVKYMQVYIIIYKVKMLVPTAKFAAQISEMFTFTQIFLSILKKKFLTYLFAFVAMLCVYK